MPEVVANQKIMFVTGRLAEAGLRDVVAALSAKLNFRYEICVPGVQVAALLHANILINRLQIPEDVDLVVVPGWLQGDLQRLSEHFKVPFERGPKDYRDLPEHFGLGKRRSVPLTDYSIEIIGEINHATRQPLKAVVAEALALSRDQADVIDVGCIPGESSSQVGDIVKALRQEGLRVSVDSFDRSEVEQAVAAGAELILSCNHSNIDWVAKLGVEVVAIPDSPSDTDSLDRLIERLTAEGCHFRADPIIEPIGMGFTASLQRYLALRERHPHVPMMMGVGNVTELTEVDSAGTNMILAAICEELKIGSVLTTQVINWCRTAVAEFDAARKLAHHAVSRQVIPKHLSTSLVMLRDARLKPTAPETLAEMAAAISDANFRVFAEESGLHLMNRNGHWSGTRPFDIFKTALRSNPEIDAGHAFYLGYEMARAEICRLLGKQYTQDDALRFGLAGELPGSASVHHEANDQA